MPALAATICNQTAVLAQTAVGIRKLGENNPITLHDQFHIGSNGKSMTATMLATLVDEGQLTWHTTPAAVWPDWATAIHPAFKTITIEQLLSHQAGLPPYEEDVEYSDLPSFPDDGAAHRLAFTRHILTHDQPVNQPGTEFRYSNAGYCVATSLAESLTGQSWETLLRERIFEPLVLNAGHGWPAATDPNQPWGHVEEDGQLVPHDPHDDYQLPPSIAPAGDIHVDFSDYTKWLQMNLRGLSGEQTLIKPDTLAYLHTPHGRAGLGWGRQELLGHQVSAHTGSAGTFFAVAVIIPAQNLGFHIATNAGYEAMEQGCIDLLKTLISAYL